MNKKIKKRIIFVLIIAVVMMVSGLGENYVKKKIEQKLAGKLDRDVSIKKLNFVWPNKIALAEVQISRHSDFGQGLACQLDKLYYDLSWRALKNQSMARASIKDGTFNIVILPDGRVNLLEFRKLRLKFEHLQIENLLLNFFLDNETEAFMSLPTSGQVWFNGCDRHIAWDIKSLALQTSGNSGLVKSYDSSQAGLKFNLVLDNFNLGEINQTENLQSWLSKTGLGEINQGKFSGALVIDGQVRCDKILKQPWRYLQKINLKAEICDWPEKIELGGIKIDKIAGSWTVDGQVKLGVDYSIGFNVDAAAAEFDIGGNDKIFNKAKAQPANFKGNANLKFSVNPLQILMAAWGQEPALNIEIDAASELAETDLVIKGKVRLGQSFIINWGKQPIVENFYDALKKYRWQIVGQSDADELMDVLGLGSDDGRIFMQVDGP